MALVEDFTVAMVRPGLGPLMMPGTDLGGQLGVDQILQRLFEHPAEQLLGAVIAETCR